MRKWPSIDFGIIPKLPSFFNFCDIEFISHKGFIHKIGNSFIVKPILHNQLIDNIIFLRK